MEEMPRHQCVIYDGSPARLLPAIAASITQRLRDNLRCLYLNSPAMVAGVRSYLFAAGVDPDDEVAKGRLILTSDQSQITDGYFDASVMIRQLEEAVSQAVKDGFDGLWATGDMGWEMGRDCDLKKLVDYEFQLEELFQRHTMLYGLCQYHHGTLSNEVI